MKNTVCELECGQGGQQAQAAQGRQRRPERPGGSSFRRKSWPTTKTAGFLLDGASCLFRPALLAPCKAQALLHSFALSAKMW